ncbi:MAG TPA: recombinase family protein [Candidatus Saccharimonadales bacterium]|nr:recombinase family protein [Candidatus Saccharimonadales bacterium]
MAEPDRAVYYGYLRTDTGNEATSAYDALVCWCVDRGWHLSTIFRDVGANSLSLRRPGFAGLLDALHLPDVAGVVVLDWTHLSDSVFIAKRLHLAVRRTGVELLVRDDGVPNHVRPPNGADSSRP